MADQIDEIKNRLNVLDVVGSYVKLSKTGVNYRGICPFHSEKGPSFFVSPSRQMFKCFGCSVGGDIFEFIKRIEGVEFGDALKILAAKAGIELRKENPKLRTERQRLYEICDLAASFFEKQLQSSSWGKEAKEYLLKRGIKEETIKKWRLGYSPDTWQGLSDFLVGRGYKREEIVKAGLAVVPIAKSRWSRGLTEKSEQSRIHDGEAIGKKGLSAGRQETNSYDRFRGRIIFPIFDLNSQVVGFGGRVFKDADKKVPTTESSRIREEFGKTAKYINTPQTLLYNKSGILYGLNNAKLSVRKNNQCVLTEGYTDAIMAHQAGFENTVAVSGTALTQPHLNLLKRYSDNLLLAFDMDLAGDTATKKGINMAESSGFNIKVADTYEGAKDPAEIILENPKNWAESLSKAKAIMDYYFNSAFASFDKKNPDGKKAIGKIILPAIKRIQNKIEQSYWTQKLAESLGVTEEAVLGELKNVKESHASEGPLRTSESAGYKDGEIKTLTTEGRKKLLEEKIISLILKEPENLNLIGEDYSELFSDGVNKIIENIKKSPLQKEVGYEAIFADISQMEEHKDFFDTLALRAEVEYEEDSPEEFQLCLLQLKDIKLKHSLNNIFLAIKSEENEQKRDELVKEFDKKAKELHKCKELYKIQA
ncbi:MAG: CHC2 zinc finger domain-containing protein [bacterium]